MISSAQVECAAFAEVSRLAALKLCVLLAAVHTVSTLFVLVLICCWLHGYALIHFTHEHRAACVCCMSLVDVCLSASLFKALQGIVMLPPDRKFVECIMLEQQHVALVYMCVDAACALTAGMWAPSELLPCCHPCLSLDFQLRQLHSSCVLCSNCVQRKWQCVTAAAGCLT